MHPQLKTLASLVGSLLLGTLPLRAAGPNAPAPVEQTYPIDNFPHWVGLVMNSGAKLKLEDGSIWEIAAKDQFQTRAWLTAQKITVSRNANAQYPFRLTNAKQTADARLATAPK